MAALEFSCQERLKKTNYTSVSHSVEERDVIYYPRESHENQSGAVAVKKKSWHEFGGFWRRGIATLPAVLPSMSSPDGPPSPMKEKVDLAKEKAGERSTPASRAGRDLQRAPKP